MKPLQGVKIVEFAALGPVSHAAMMLRQLGAEVIHLHRPGTNPLVLPATDTPHETHALDLKNPTDMARARALIAGADVLIEGFRPGVMERLGLGPNEVAAAQPRIIYCRMTGWGQTGPLAHKAGHDINFLAETGALWAIRTDGNRPTPPLNLVGDNGGGSVYLVNGVLAALFERERSGRGCTIDVAIVDGVTSLLETVRDLQNQGGWADAPAANLFDSGAPFYDTYECADGEHMAVGAIEEPFYRAFLEGLGLDPTELPSRNNAANWPQLRAQFAAKFLERTRDAWATVFDRLDACTTPVLSIREAATSKHLNARETVKSNAQGITTSNRAPRFTAHDAGLET